MTKNTSATPISSHAAFTGCGSSVHPVLSLPAQLIAELPEPVALRLHVPGSPVPVCLWTGTRAELREVPPVLADTIIFDRDEISALVCAASADRLWHADFLGLCFEKWRQPEKQVQEAEALGGANPDSAAAWNLERVFRRLGVELEAVEFDVVPVAHPLHVAA